MKPKQEIEHRDELFDKIQELTALLTAANKRIEELEWYCSEYRKSLGLILKEAGKAQYVLDDSTIEDICTNTLCFQSKENEKQ